MRVLGYIRVSTEDQVESGAGLSAQKQAIEQACAQSGYDLVDFVTDEGVSAKDLVRPGIAELMERLEDRDADALMVAKLDRLSRSVLDFAGLIEMSRREGWALICLDLGVDTSTAAGEVMANVLAAFAQFERRLISERTKAALAQKKLDGVIIGRPRDRPAWVETEIRRMRDAGLSFRQIVEALEEDRVPTVRGGKRWYPSTVRAILVSSG